MLHIIRCHSLQGFEESQQFVIRLETEVAARCGWSVSRAFGRGARPNVRFRKLCELAGIRPKMNVETGEAMPWLLKDLRKASATYYDQHVPESSISILGHSVGGITYRHYAHRTPMAFKAIMTLPQPSAFMALVRGFDNQCPCCRRSFE